MWRSGDLTFGHHVMKGLLLAALYEALKFLPIDACSGCGALVAKAASRRYAVLDARARENKIRRFGHGSRFLEQFGGTVDNPNTQARRIAAKIVKLPNLIC
jgi:hypothetical protein